MAGTFKIHLDNESESRYQEVKPKEIKAIGKRCVLGQITNNHLKDTFKTVAYAASKKDVIPKELSLLSSGLTENIKALELQEKDKKNLNCKLLKNSSSVRSPLKDLRTKERVINSKHAEDLHSPMYIDKPPNDNYETKENFHSKQLNKNSIKALTKQEEKVTNLKNNNLLINESPMSVDSSPTHPSKGESSLSDIEDLYGYLTYKEDIYKYLRKIEEVFRPKAYYMRRQPDVTYSMRTILVDWLVEVGEEFKLKNETLFMAVSYIDRFLSTMAVAKPKLQLLGTSALFIAAKFEEIYPPEVGEFTYITDDSYTVKQLLRMERLILKVLSFDLSCPTSYTFIMHISSCVKLPSKIIFLAMYICELALLEADPYLDFHPSLIACGAIALSRRCLDYSDIWPSSLAKIAGYPFLQLGAVVSHLNETHNKSFTLQQTAIRQKYGVAEYEYVSQVPCKKLAVRDSFVN